MTSQYRHRRTSIPSTAFPSPLEPGEIAVNTANRQLAVGDAASTTLGAPLALIAVRYFDTRAQYAAGELVVNAGNIYRANAIVAPGVFTPANWTAVAGVALPSGNNPLMNGAAAPGTGALISRDDHIHPTDTSRASVAYVDAADSANAAAAAAKVAKAGDTMTGPLILNADPTNARGAATKQYVDNKPVGPTVLFGDTAPAGAADGSLWFETDTGLTFVKYNDGNSSQWVIACPQPDPATYMTASQAVRYDTAQALTVAQQNQARLNVGLNQTIPLAANTDLNTITTPGTYYTLDPSCTNGPYSDYWYLVVEIYSTSSSGDTMQRIVSLQSGVVFNRIQLGAAWKPWQALIGTLPFPAGITAAQQTQARQNIYAAPFDALAYNGMQINGSMDVSQENGTTSIPLTNGVVKQTIDGFIGYGASSAGVFSLQQIVPPGVPSFGTAFQNCLQMKATTGGTPSAGESFTIAQNLEGYRVARLGFGNSAAQPISIGFWVYTTIAGTMGVQLGNSAGNRNCFANVVINSAATWEFKTVTIPGDISGTWLNTNGIGLRLRFCCGCDAALQGTANVWGSSLFLGSSAQTNFFVTTNNVVCITGLVVLPGIEVPSAARSPLIMRPFDQELLVCQRQLYVFQPGDGVTLYARNQGDTYRCVSGHFPCQMRAAPTVTGTGILNYAGGQLAATCAAYLNSWTVSYSGTLASDIFVIQNFKADARL
jgi:hypothetical protein